MNRIKKCIIVILAMVIIMISLLGNYVYADSTIKIKMDNVRYDGEGNQVEAYAISNGTNRYLFQLLSVDDENQITGTNYYCLNADVGASWINGSISTPVEYDSQYDLNNNLSLDGVDSSITAYQKVEDSEYLPQLLWVIDNMYVKDGIKTIEDLLAEAGIVYNSTYGYYYYDRTINPSSVFSNTNSPLYRNAYGNPITSGYYYQDEDYNRVDVLLSDYPELVEAIQQAVIWYFTNYKSEEGSAYNTFDNYTSAEDTSPKKWIKYANVNNPSNLDYLYNKTLTVNGLTVNLGLILQEQADILYNYLIDSANTAAGEGYSGADYGTINLTYTGSDPDKKIVKEGNNYKIGPIKVSVTGNTYLNNLIVSTGDDTDITLDVTLKDTSENIIDEITKDQDFYVIVPQDVVDGDITINVSGDTSKIERRLLLSRRTDNSLAEQPVVNFYPTMTNLSKSLTVEPSKTFDLALRKFITAVSTDGNFENTESTTTYNRAPSIENAEITKLGNEEATYDNGKTAKKTHSKTAVEVTTGSKVRYTIRVYNEGDVDGEATEITDYLPSGLKLAENSAINITYGWEAGENNSVTTDYLNDKTISALSGTTLDYEDVQIECEVTATSGATEKSLKNVAEITGASNEYNYEDRDSGSDNVEEKGNDYEVETSPNGKGYEDDDDYEELKIPVAQGAYTIRLQKVSSSNTNTVLSGATFSVELADGTTKNITSGTGYVTIAENVAITGEGTDTIKITETNAPGGYNKLLNELNVNLTKTLSGGVYGISAVSISDTTNASYDLNNNVISITIKDEPKTFDLSLRKFITAVSTDGNFENTESTTTYNRAPSIENAEITKLGSTTATYDNGKTAKKTHSKTAVEVTTGSKVRYTIRVYNEGEVDGKAGEITDYLPSGLKLAENSTINTTYGWEAGENGKVTTNYLNNKTISALSGTTLDYEDVQIECEVTEASGATEKSLKNVAEITGASNEYNYEDRDSDLNNVEEKGNDYEVETSPNGKGYEDDDDYEELKIPSAQGVYTIRLQKVSSSNTNTKLSGATFSVELADGTTKNITSGTGYVTIAENVAITGEGTDTITITETNAPGGYNKLLNELNVNLTKTLSGGVYGISAVSISDTTNASYDLNNNVISITIKDEPKTFDLALRKFITAVSTDGNFENTESTTTYNRAPSIENAEITKLGSTTATYDEGRTAKKTHSKTAVEVTTGSKVRYTIRVYNEGEVDGKAGEITDYLPSGLKLAENSAINTTYGWEAGENGKVTTDYLNDKTISALSGTTLDYEDVQIECEVTEVAGATEKSLKNVAEITGASNDYGYTDRDSAPDNVNTNNYTPTNPTDGKGEQDDDDYEEIKIPALPKTFDLSLRKFITAVSTDGNFENTESTTTYNRAPSIENAEITKLGNTTATYDNGKTAKKTHSKNAVEVTTGSKVRYTIRVYNEGEVDGKAEEITDYLPSGLKLAENSTINTTYGWTPGENGKVTTNYLNNKTISALSGTTLDYEDVQIECEVTEVAGATEKSLKNVAEITGASNDYNYEDRDSVPDNVNKDNYTPTNPADGRGEQDDDDYEEIKIPSAQGVYTIRLQKVSSENADTKLSGAEFSVELADGTTKNITSRTSYVTIAENVAIAEEGTDTIKITETNAPEGYKKLLDELTVTLNKTLSGGVYGISAVSISDTTNASYDLNNNIISITIKDEPIKQNGAYSLILVKEDEEGEQLKSKATFEINGEEKEITGRLVIAENIEINADNVEKQDIYTIKETKAPDEYSSFNGTITITVDKKLDGTAYGIEKVSYKVVDEEGNDITSIKDANVYLSKDGNIYVEVKNYEIKKFDLALRKFITNIGKTEVTSRIPQISYDNNRITYTHTKEAEKVHIGDIVTYTIRAFNEGELDGFAEKISDDIPEYLEYLPDNKTNIEYRWIMYDKDGKETTNVNSAVKIVSDYTSKINGEAMMKANNLKENPNLLKALKTNEKISNDNPDFVDIKVSFKVKNPNSNTITIINNAQISEDADEDGNPINDLDSTPDKWNEGEDDQDYETVSVEYFDLSLLKYVKKAIITENDKTRTIKTKNNGSDKDVIPKVEVNRKRVNNTIVKFEYAIEIKNEGDIAGYAKEIKDYVPKGLKFYEEDNTGWKDEGKNVISTELLKNTLLQPGQSTTVKVVLRWVNGENNLGIKTNVAEISKDYNEKEVHDRDSTPNNKKQKEDDIDDAQVLLTISTGFFENTTTYIFGALIILVILGLGIIAIKRYVL